MNLSLQQLQRGVIKRAPKKKRPYGQTPDTIPPPYYPPIKLPPNPLPNDNCKCPHYERQENQTMGRLPFSLGTSGEITVFPSATGAVSTAPANGTIHVNTNDPNKFSQIIALISQGLGAFGKRETVQIGSPAMSAIGGNYSATGQQQISPELAALQLEQQRLALAALNNRSNGGDGVGDGINKTFDWVKANPLTVAAVVGGAFLLMKEPPRRRS